MWVWTSHFAAFEKNLVHICRWGLEPGLMRKGLAINYTTAMWTRLSWIQLNCVWLCGPVWSYTLQSSWFFLIMVYTFFVLNMLLHVSAVVEKVYEMNWRYLAVPVPNVWYNTVEVVVLHTTWLQTQVFSILNISFQCVFHLFIHLTQLLFWRWREFSIRGYIYHIFSWPHDYTRSWVWKGSVKTSCR